MGDLGAAALPSAEPLCAPSHTPLLGHVKLPVGCMSLRGSNHTVCGVVVVGSGLGVNYPPGFLLAAPRPGALSLSLSLSRSARPLSSNARSLERKLGLANRKSFINFVSLSSCAVVYEGE